MCIAHVMRALCPGLFNCTDRGNNVIHKGGVVEVFHIKEGRRHIVWEAHFLNPTNSIFSFWLNFQASALPLCLIGVSRGFPDKKRCRIQHLKAIAGFQCSSRNLRGCSVWKKNIYIYIFRRQIPNALHGPRSSYGGENQWCQTEGLCFKFDHFCAAAPASEAAAASAWQRSLLLRISTQIRH